MEFWELEAAFMVGREEEEDAEQREEERESNQGERGRVKEEKEKVLYIITKTPLPSRSFYFRFFNNKHC